MRNVENKVKYHTSFASISKKVKFFLLTLLFLSAVPQLKANKELRIANSKQVDILQDANDTIPQIPIRSDQSQLKEITGVVVDAQGRTIPGVYIKTKNDSIGGITDIDGNFKLHIPPKSTLVFTFLGYQDTEIPIKGQNHIKVVLKEDVQSLEEIVVVGYGAMRKQNLTGSVSSVNFDQAMTSRPTMNLSSALTGLSAGLNISQNSGSPGAENMQILVRGQGTMNDASPLIIIDGIPGQLNDVNPSDVESVSVLKDAASSSIYGSRAANGVILVTTKKGDKSRLSVNYSGYVGWQSAAKKVDFINDMVTHIELVNGSYGRNVYDVNEIEKWRTQSAAGNPLYPNTDWYNEMLNTSLITEHNLTVRGGSDNSSYSLSLGYLDNKGVIDNSSYKKYSFRVNVDTNPTSWLNLGTNVSGLWSDRDPIDEKIFYSTIKSVVPGVIPKSADGRYGGNMFNGMAGDGENPRAYVDNIRGNYENQKIGLKVYGKIKFLKYFEWENSFGFNYNHKLDWVYSRPYTLWNFQKEIAYPIKNGPDDTLVNATQRDYTTIFNSLLRFNYSWKDKHNFSVLLGYDQQYNKMNMFDAKKKDILGDDVIYVMDAGLDMVGINGSATDDALVSYLGRINYNYKGKYLVEANARYDGSSRFARNNRWGFFPSFSAGWRITEEPFAKPLKKAFNDLKIRGSWGKLGNNRIGDYTYQIIYESQPYPFGGNLQSGLAPKTIANSSIKWETTTLSNIGLDLAMWDNRFSLSLDYYTKTTNDILAKIPIPLTVGNFEPPWQNLAEMKNSGIELQASYHGSIGKDFTYAVSGNISTVRNRVTKYKGESIDEATKTIEGKPYRSFFVYEVDHIIQDQAEIDQLIADGYTFSSHVGGTPEPGDFLYKDTDGNKVFNDEDRVLKKSSIPKITYGINLNATYKNLDLSIMGQGVGGVHGYWGGDGFNTFNINDNFLIRENVLKHWTPENQSKKYPRLRQSTDARNSSPKSDYWLYNTSFFRIKSVQLGYSIPKKLTSKLMIDQLRVYTNLENFFTFTDFEGFNPENPTMSYPLMKQWTIGLNLTF